MKTRELTRTEWNKIVYEHMVSALAGFSVEFVRSNEYSAERVLALNTKKHFKFSGLETPNVESIAHTVVQEKINAPVP